MHAATYLTLDVRLLNIHFVIAAMVSSANVEEEEIAFVERVRDDLVEEGVGHAIDHEGSRPCGLAVRRRRAKHQNATPSGTRPFSVVAANGWCSCGGHARQVGGSGSSVDLHRLAAGRHSLDAAQRILLLAKDTARREHHCDHFFSVSYKLPPSQPGYIQWVP